MKTIEELYTLRNTYASKFSDERVKPQPLYKCQARVYNEGDNVYLYSYNTLVAMYTKSENILYSFGRFSMTTYMHVRKFRKWCWENYATCTHEWDIVEHMEEFENWF